MTVDPLDAATPVGRNSRALIVAWIAFWVLVTISMLATIDQKLMALVAAPMAATLHLSNLQLGLVQGFGFAVFSTVASYPLAWLADRTGSRAVLIGCAFLWGGGLVACAVARGFSQVFYGSIAVAAGELGAVPIIFAAVSGLFHGKERQVATRVYYIASYLATSVGFFAGGLLQAALQHPQTFIFSGAVRSFEGWRLTLLVAALPAPLLATSLIRLPVGHTAANALKTTDSNLQPYLRAHWRTVGIFFASGSASVLASSSMLAWLPLALIRRYQVTPADAGILVGAVFAGAVVLGAVCGQKLLQSRRQTSEQGAIPRTAAIGLVIAAFALAIIPITATLTQTLAAAGLAMFGWCASGAPMMYLMQDISPAHLRARIVAMYVMVAAPFGGIGAIAVGGLLDLLHGGNGDALRAIAWIAAPAFCVSAWLMWVIERYFATTAERVARENESALLDSGIPNCARPA